MARSTSVLAMLAGVVVASAAHAQYPASFRTGTVATGHAELFYRVGGWGPSSCWFMAMPRRATCGVRGRRRWPAPTP